MIIVATTSLPAVDRPNADRWNAARSCQYFGAPNLLLDPRIFTLKFGWTQTFVGPK